jgi:putative peptide zinc metalloprotease protein
VALALTALAIALASLPLRLGVTVQTALIAPLLWLVALGAQLVLHSDYERAAISKALDSFMAVSAIELLALAGYLLLPGQSALWAGLEIVGFALLLFAGLVALLDVDLRQSTPAELAGSALLLAAAFLGGGLAVAPIQQAQPAAPFIWLVLQATPVYASLLALALLLPLLAAQRDSRLLWSWLLLWLGIAAQTVSYMLELLPASRNTPPAIAAMVLSSGLWCAAWCSHLVALRQISVRGLGWPLQPARGEAERLRAAFQHSYAALYRTLRHYAGTRRARLLDDRMDVLAATANWDITLDREDARVSPAVAALPLDAQGLRYAEVLRYAVGAIQGLCGATFARRAVLAAYDALPWPEREAADRRCFPHTPWAAELSKAFGGSREARLRLLRQVELFDACDDGELLALAAAMETRRVSAGALLLAAGAAAQGVWIVEAGEVAVKEGERLVGELHRGACFGEAGGDPAAGHSYRATVETELLYLPQPELQRMLREAAPHTAEGVALLEAVRLLERVPLLDDLPRAELRALARAASRRTLAPRTLVVREGQPSGMFYVIEAGQAAVVRRSAAKADAEATPGPPKVIARLGPAEFFGELELLHGTPPVASVVTIAETQLLALPHAALARLLTGADGLARGLEQVGSGRLLELRGEGVRG